MGNFCEAPQVQLSSGPLLISEYLYKPLIISVFQGDISEEDSDALVISNTPRLSANYPATRSILNRAGSKIQIEIGDLLISLNEFEYGTTLYTSAGELEAIFLFHAVIPEWGADDAEAKFEECIKNCLKLAEKMKINTISFPILGTLNNSFPRDISCELTMKVVKRFCDDSVGFERDLKSVRIISSENPTVRLVKSIGDRIFLLGSNFGSLRKTTEVKSYQSLSLTTIEKKGNNE